MSPDKMNGLIAEANYDIHKFALLIQLDLLAIAKANLVLSNDAKELYKDLHEYILRNDHTRSNLA